MAVLMRLLNLAVALVLSAAGVHEFEWSGKLAAGQSVEVKGVNGTIRAHGAGESVSVTAHKHGRRDDPAQVEVRVVPHAAGVTICAVYPSRDGRPNECVPGPGGHMDARDNDVDVDFQVELPRDVRFVARTVNGNVDAEDLGAAVEAVTVNGNVRLATAGLASAETVNGNVEARLGRDDGREAADFKTVNGNVEVRLPEGANAEVEAHTVNGGIVSDFPLNVEGKWGPKRAHGTLGSGGRRLSLTTVNGSVRLEKE